MSDAYRTPTTDVLLRRMLARLRLRHLQALVKLAELHHMGRAAQAMGLTQPAVSLLLADLEALIEAPLFERQRRGLVPTALARQLLPLVRHTLARLEESADAVAAHHAQADGLVRVVATIAAANGLLAELLPGFMQANPSLRVSVAEVDVPAHSIAAAIDTGAADLVACRRPVVLPQDWAFYPCRGDRFVVACGPQHPLAQMSAVSRSDLLGATWLPNAVGSAARERFASLWAGEALPQECGVVTRISPLTWHLLASQPLLTLVPESIVRPWLNRGLLRVLRTPLELPFDPLGLLLPEAGVQGATRVLAEYILKSAVPDMR